MIEQYENFQMKKDYFLPVRIMAYEHVERVEELTVKKRLSISFRTDNCARFTGKGSWILLDYGKELAGGLRIVTRAVDQGTGGKGTKVRITFGESVTEACTVIGEKNAVNDHSTRDMTVFVPSMSDLEFGQTGFRFVRVELLEDKPWDILSMVASCNLPVLEQEAKIVTNDPLLNQIIETAAYTLKLNFQNGYIWDGIKRDRLVWCGDLHPEILTSLYIFGKTNNVPNCLDFLRENTLPGCWINNIPSYSAWWVVNLCDYVQFTGETEYFEKNYDYAEEILRQFDGLIDEDGTMHLPGYFLDWPSKGTPDAPAGVAALVYWTAEKYLTHKACAAAESIMKKLADSRNLEASMKQIRAFQVMAGGDMTGAKELLEAGCAKGMSTFMSYYILTGAAMTGSTEMLNMLKEYYGGMLSRGATSFWEDFDIDWLEGSGRIDELPAPGEKDLHGDFGKFCYTQFRHSLCHGWSSGVLAFIIEHIVGLQVGAGYREVSVNPHSLGLTDVDASFPTPYGTLSIHTHNGKTEVDVPEGMILR